MFMNKKFEGLKVAIVHDFMWQVRGGEKCVEALCEIFPDADVYMMFGDTSSSKIIPKHKTTFTFLQKFPFLKKYYRYTYFLWPIAIETFDLNGYDLIISTSASAAKGIVPGLNSLHISYTFTPMRYAWDMTFEYFNPLNFSLWKRLVIPMFLNYIRIWDVSATDRIDVMVPISEYIAKRIKKYYRRDPDPVIYPPVDVKKGKISEKKEDYLVAIAPFEPNKGGRLIVETAIRDGFNLKLIGDGTMKKELEERAKGHENIEFLGWLDEEGSKWDVVSKAKGYLFCGVEDFGIVPVEAMACGVPVIAYAQGGALETVVDGKTGIFFYEQTVDALSEAIKLLDKKDFSSKDIQKHTEKFSRDRFIREIERLVADKMGLS